MTQCENAFAEALLVRIPPVIHINNHNSSDATTTISLSITTISTFTTVTTITTAAATTTTLSYIYIDPVSWVLCRGRCLIGDESGCPDDGSCGISHGLPMLYHVVSP